LEDRRNVGESSCNSGDGTDQRVQYLMFVMMNGCPSGDTSRYRAERFTLDARITLL